ncbi:hypothetical protein TRIUR3_09398 [Triticum urartu]|uniref:Uncharacterized protein n=1 Tax=Triticum urartu TaxID=4572 RepID=M8A089_TRIUA|nr:hypothetical protein TRIUR3_09398 [Triticum urartu]
MAADQVLVGVLPLSLLPFNTPIQRLITTPKLSEQLPDSDFLNILTPQDVCTTLPVTEAKGHQREHGMQLQVRGTEPATRGRTPNRIDEEQRLHDFDTYFF